MIFRFLKSSKFSKNEFWEIFTNSATESGGQLVILTWKGQGDKPGSGQDWKGQSRVRLVRERPWSGQTVVGSVLGQVSQSEVIK